jgi:hypothetical protein
MNEEQKENMLKILEHIRKRPYMYFSTDVPAVATFLDGFKLAYSILNPDADFNAVFIQEILKRGWNHSAQAVWHQMRERGFDDEAMITELLAIHSAVWEKIILQLDSVEHKINNEA